MGILNIRPATRAGSKVVLGICGQSGSGKTLTALYIARGMVDKPEEIGFLDTENGRGSFYSDKLDGPFMIGDLEYPFTPARYAQAIKEFEDAGVKVLVIDSVSHEWESGCMEIAEAPMLRGKKMADWKLAKSEHKKYMNVLLHSNMHIICCVRAAEKMDFSNPREPQSMGIQPLCEKNFMFEMTASIMMFNEGMTQEHRKVPGDLKSIFSPNAQKDGNGITWNHSYLGEDAGRALRSWAEGEEFDEELKTYRNKMKMASLEGSESLKAAWTAMPESAKKKMEPFKRQLWASALSVDSQNANDNQDEENNEGFQPAPKTESNSSFNPKPDEKKEEDAKPDSSDFKEDDFG